MVSLVTQIHKELERYPGARLLGVTKGQPPNRVREVVNEGLLILGNNYVQEGETLRAGLKDLSLEWHFIGHIQSRKAKDLIGYHCIESLDRIEVADALNKRLSDPINVLIQINIGEEPQKSGVSPDGLESFLGEMVKFPLLKVKGLMALPPLSENPEGRRPYFRKMRQLFDRTGKATPLETLSMGMSDDYRIALDEGSNLIRLGTILFGARV